LAPGVDPDQINWPNLGYADAYTESFQIFRRLRQQGVIPDSVRFQVEYPTPLASIDPWVVKEDQPRLEPSYERALFADLNVLLARLPHQDIAVQWDVAVEIAILEAAFEAAQRPTLEAVGERLLRCIAQVPEDVSVGFHLCYGDYQHRHFKEPESLQLQVRLANHLTSRASRPVSWFSFTVPQYQRSEEYFLPLRELQVPAQTELYFSLVPYHPAEQPPGTTEEQVRLVDHYLAIGHGPRVWGICTECGMGRVQPGEVPQLLDLHRAILERFQPRS
jgi:hypothetical protein